MNIMSLVGVRVINNFELMRWLFCCMYVCVGGGGCSPGIRPKVPESLRLPLDQKDAWVWTFCHITSQKKYVLARKEDIGKENLFFQVSNEVREFPLTWLPIINMLSGGREKQNNGFPKELLCTCF